MKFGLGQSAPRVEDQRFLTGLGRYTDDHNLPGQARAVVVRSAYPHARISGMDKAAALAAPGVVAVLDHADLVADGVNPIPSLGPKLLPLKRPSGEPIYEPEYPALAGDIARYAGQPVALVVAETAAQARDAAELLEVDYEPLDACIDTATAHLGDAPVVWPDCPDNVCFQVQMGDRDGVDKALAGAAHVTRLRLPVSRVCTNAMEPRGALGNYDEHDGRYTLWSGHQNPHHLRKHLATRVFDVPESQVRVVSPDMGGAFGLRASIFPELVLVLWASKRLGRPVKWLGERSEMIVAEDQSRDMVMDVSLALSAEGDFQAVEVKSVAACGAFLSYFSPLPAFGNMGGVAGVYRTPNIHIDVTGVFSHTTPIAPYRGAGRPEAAFIIELLIDAAAKELGIDRIALRRRNVIAPDAMPFQTGLSYKYDCGEFEANMDKALGSVDFAGFEARRAESKQRGMLRGLGVVNAIEQAAGMADEAAEIRFDADGSVTVTMGVHSHGQGHETVFRQLLADRLGLEFEQVRYVQGDTDRVPYGHGTNGSRGSGLGSAALAIAADRIIDKGKRIAAAQLEAAEQDVEFDAGRFSVPGTDLKMSLAEVAAVGHDPARRPAGDDAGFSAYSTWKPPAPTFPNACHACEIEVDPATGVTSMERYVIVEDCGTIMNPRLLSGQLQGGVVQGFGQIMMENVVYDDGGQQLSGSFMDYCMPRADDVPFCEIDYNPVLTKTNPLGIKGVGEAGTVGSMPAVMAALLDALAPAGVNEIAMPASPHRIWKALL
jgi:carbon-monoxide dehydrogenase large subunit